jgi:hypothetical protein
MTASSDQPSDRVIQRSKPFLSTGSPRPAFPGEWTGSSAHGPAAPVTDLIAAERWVDLLVELEELWEQSHPSVSPDRSTSRLEGGVPVIVTDALGKYPAVGAVVLSLRRPADGPQSQPGQQVRAGSRLAGRPGRAILQADIVRSP